MEISNETKVLAGVLLLTVVIIIVGAMVAGRDGGGQVEVPVVSVERLVRDDDPAYANATAGTAGNFSEHAVTVVEFGDFQCPACGALQPVLGQVKEQNVGESVRFVFRQFPLNSIHDKAQLAAEASLAAQEQGKFWEYHDTLYENQSELTRADLERYAGLLDLDVVKFAAALDNSKYTEAVIQDVADGNAVGVRATPSIYINGVLFTGRYSVDSLQVAINDELLK